MLKGNRYIFFQSLFVILYSLFQVTCPVGISLFLFKMLYMAWVPFFCCSMG